MNSWRRTLWLYGFLALQTAPCRCIRPRPLALAWAGDVQHLAEVLRQTVLETTGSIFSLLEQQARRAL